MKLFRQARTREDLYAVEYRRGDQPTKTLPIYAPSEQRAVEMAALFGVRTGCEVLRLTQIPFYVLSFGAYLPGQIYV